MLTKLPRISLEQWLTFKTIVDEGSYVLAAECLNKSQSSISYAINRLNSQLPQPVLKLEGRKAVITDEGKILYRYADQLLKQAAETEAVAKSLAMGFESEISIALDVLIEIGALTCALEEFSKAFPHTRVRILETSLSGTSEALLEGLANLVIGSKTPVGFSGTALTQVSMLPVAAPSHPLCTSLAAITELELREHRQIVLRDSGARRKQDAGWLGSEQRWTVSHFSSSIKLIKSGLGFAFVPRNWIELELEQNQLQQIALHESMDRNIQMYLMLADKQAAGPATRALAESIIKHFPPLLASPGVE